MNFLSGEPYPNITAEATVAQAVVPYYTGSGIALD